MAEPLNATFFAFRKRERGGVLLGASISLAVILFASILGLGFINAMLMGLGPTGMFTSTARASADLSSGTGNFGLILLIQIVYSVLLFILLASFEAACLRWMIRGERPGLFGLTLNADTWRVYGTYWMWLLMLIVGYVGILLLAVVMSFLASMVGRDNPLITGVLGIVILIMFLTLPIYLLVRTAPASATTVGRQQFSFFDAWKVTRGRFWSLFGAYFLLWLIYMVLVVGAWGAWFGTMIGPSLGGLFNGNPTAASQAISQAMVSGLSTPAGIGLYWALQIVGYAVWLVFSVMTYGVNARAVLAAADEGKIDGVVSAGLAKTFE